MSNSSDFITKSEAFDVEILEQCGATSLTYKIQLNGQTCFMKKLRPELRNDNRYRELFYKEYNTGKCINILLIFSSLPKYSGSLSIFSFREHPFTYSIIMQVPSALSLMSRYLTM